MSVTDPKPLSLGGLLGSLTSAAAPQASATAGSSIANALDFTDASALEYANDLDFTDASALEYANDLDFTDASALEYANDLDFSRCFGSWKNCQ